MAYTSKNIVNNGQSLLASTITNSDTIIVCTTWEWSLFPTSGTPLVLEQFNTSNQVTKREIVNLTGRTGDTLTITRAYEACVQDDTASIKTSTQNALSFDLWDGVVKISQYMTKKILDDIQAELTDINTNYATKADVQAGSLIYSSTSTGTDAYAITLSPAPASYTGGMSIKFLADVANTGTATLDVNSLGAKTIKKKNDQDLSDSDIEANQIVEVIYNATDDVFEMVNQLASEVVIPPTEKLKKSLTSGEALTANYVYRKGNGALQSQEFTQTTYDETDAFTDSSGYIGSTFTVEWLSGESAEITSVTIFRTDTPWSATTPLVTATIYTDTTKTTSLWSKTVWPGLGENLDLVITFDSAISVTSGTQYFIEWYFDQNGTGSADFGWRQNSTSVYSGGSLYKNQVENASKDLYFKVQQNVKLEDGDKYYHALANDINKIGCLGIVESWVSADTAFNGIFDGIVGGYSSLLTWASVWDPVYLQDNGSVWKTTGTNEVQVGTIFSDTEIVFWLRESQTISFTRTMSTSTFSATYTHNLGRIPKTIHCRTTYLDDVNSFGFYADGDYAYSGYLIGTWEVAAGSDAMWLLVENSSQYMKMTVTDRTASTITITYTEVWAVSTTGRAHSVSLLLS